MIYKKTILITLVSFLLLYSGCTKKQAEVKNNKIKYIAYYFHPTARCESCINLENYVKDLIETKYTDHSFSFKEVNIEQKENEHFRKDFDLKFSSVILVNLQNNKWQNLDSVWSYTDNKEKFFNYTEKEINSFINSN